MVDAGVREVLIMPKFRVGFKLEYYFSEDIEAINSGDAAIRAGETIPEVIEEHGMELQGGEVVVINVVDSDPAPHVNSRALQQAIDKMLEAAEFIKRTLDKEGRVTPVAK